MREKEKDVQKEFDPGIYLNPWYRTFKRKFTITPQYEDYHVLYGLLLMFNILQAIAPSIADCSGFIVAASLIGLRGIDDFIFFTLGTVFCVNIHYCFFIAWVMTYSAFIKMTLPGIVFRRMADAYLHLHRMSRKIAASNLPVGCNSNSHFDKVWDKINEFLIGVRNAVLFTNSATYVGEVDVKRTSIPYSRQFMRPKEAYELYQSCRKIKVGLWLLLGPAICGIFLGMSSFLAGMFLVVLLYIFRDSIENVQESLPRSGSIRQGAYILEKRVFGYVIESAVGYSHQGVLHTPFHYSKSLAIEINGRKFSPSFSDENCDLTTYGGQPQFSYPPSHCRVGIQTIVTSGGTTNYAIPIIADGNVVTFPNVTSPGESGSPIFIHEEDETRLIGLGGLWLRRDTDESTGIIITTALDDPMTQDTRITQICKYPGFGKTRKVIPDLINKFFNKYQRTNTKIVVSGPTKVICEEMFRNLASRFPGQVAARVSSLPDTIRNDNCRIQVMAHETLMYHLIRGSKAVRGVKAVILDEAHSDFTSTTFIKYWLENMEDIEGYLLSATFETLTDFGSNYPINDIKFNYNDFTRIVKKELDEGKKVAIFVSGSEGIYGSRSVLKKPFLKGHKVISLNRNTFERVKNDIAIGDYDVIVTTNIAECGVNLDIDTVIDFSRNFYFKQMNGEIRGITEIISQASKIQRRGRVGRLKPGTYYYLDDPVSQMRTDTASYFETWLLTKDNDWELKPCFEDMGIFPRISTQQAIKMIELRIPLTQAIIEFDDNGKKRCKSGLDAMIQSMFGGGICNTFCPKGKKSCFCLNNMHWWDERLHDFLEKHLMGHQTVKVQKEGDTDWAPWEYSRDHEETQEMVKMHLIKGKGNYCQDLEKNNEEEPGIFGSLWNWKKLKEDSDMGKITNLDPSLKGGTPKAIGGQVK